MAEPLHHFSTTQIDLPAEIADQIRSFAASIPNEDLAEDGREDNPHITVRYGLHGDDPAAVGELLADQVPITLRFGKTSIFDASENHDYDVVKVDVYSPEIHAINETLAELEHTQTQPSYVPHATIAYVKAGTGVKYEGDPFLAAQEIEANAITFKSKLGEATEIPLSGTGAGGKMIKPRIKAHFTKETGESLNDRIDRISAALRKAFKIPGDENDRSRFYWPRECFDDFVISEEDETAKLFKIPYTEDGDKVTFGEPVEVREQFVEVKEKTAGVKFAQGSDDVIEGIGIPFGGPFNGKDWHGEFFNKETDLCFDWFKERPLLYSHGLDGAIQTETVGVVKEAVLKENGWWVRAQLDRSKRFWRDVHEVLAEKALYFSSGALPHLVRTVKETGQITRWPWVELTLTPSPANFYANLDFASFEKHCKEVGIEIRPAIKSLLEPDPSLISRLTGKKDFDQVLAEMMTPTLWDVLQAFNREVCNIENLLQASEGTGVSIDATTLVDALIAKFIPKLREMVISWLGEEDTESIAVSMRSAALEKVKAIIDAKQGGPLVRLSLADHSEAVLAANEEFITRVKAVHELRAKEGRAMNTDRLKKLTAIHTQIGEIHTQLGSLITEVNPPAKEPPVTDYAEKQVAMKRRTLSLKTSILAAEA